MMCVLKKNKVQRLPQFFPAIVAIWLLCHASVYSQSFSIEPVIGYTRVSMDAVNADIRYKVNKLSAQTGNTIMLPDPLEGNLFWGIQANYHMENNYFLNVGTSYYREVSDLTQGNAANMNTFYFHTRRENQLLKFNFGIRYYFNYNSWNRVNFYLGGGTGYALGWSDYRFEYGDGTNSINNTGNFSSGAITAYLSTGISLRFMPRFSLNPEVGYHYANLGQMTGRYQISQIFPKDPAAQLEGIYTDFITEEEYNFSGFFASIGLHLFFNILD
jgi:hypothetical protein